MIVLDTIVWLCVAVQFLPYYDRHETTVVVDKANCLVTATSAVMIMGCHSDDGVPHVSKDSLRL